MANSYMKSPPTAYGVSSAVWVVTGATVRTVLTKLLLNTTYKGALDSLGQCITAIYMLPFRFPGGPLDYFPIKVGDYNVGGFNGYSLGDITNENPSFIAQFNFKLKDRQGYITNSFVDYSLSEYQIYIPYFGEIDLAPDVFCNSDLNLTYTLDVSTGYLNAKLVDTTNDVLVYEDTTAVATPIPFTADNSGAINAFKKNAERSNAAQLVGAGASLLAGMALAPYTAGASVVGAGLTYASVGASAVSNGANLMANFSNAQNKTYSAKTTVGNPNIAPFFSTVTPFIYIARQRYITPASYGHNVGYPCNSTFKISDLTGYTDFSSIHIKGINATATEISEIEQKLLSGVIINNGGVIPPKPEDPPFPEPPEPEPLDSLCPIKGNFRITATIGEKTAPYSQTNPHRGIDFVAESNQVIYCPDDNWRVDYVGWDNSGAVGGGFGYYVRLKREPNLSQSYKPLTYRSYRLYFAHLVYPSTITGALKVGQQLNRGDPIGVMGATGNVTGTHLHLEMRPPADEWTGDISYTLSEYLKIPNEIGSYTYNWDDGKLSKR